MFNSSALVLKKSGQFRSFPFFTPTENRDIKRQRNTLSFTEHRVTLTLCVFSSNRDVLYKCVLQIGGGLSRCRSRSAGTYSAVGRPLFYL